MPFPQCSQFPEHPPGMDPSCWQGSDSGLPALRFSFPFLIPSGSVWEQLRVIDQLLHHHLLSEASNKWQTSINFHIFIHEKSHGFVPKIWVYSGSFFFFWETFGNFSLEKWTNIHIFFDKMGILYPNLWCDRLFVRYWCYDTEEQHLIETCTRGFIRVGINSLSY